MSVINDEKEDRGGKIYIEKQCNIEHLCYNALTYSSNAVNVTAVTMNVTPERTSATTPVIT